MTKIMMGTATDPQMDQATLVGMYRLRDTIFHKRLKWDVESRIGLEIDAFDALSPVYMVARGETRVEGCWRLLPTTGPYMLKDTFSELLHDEPAPQHPAIWELSRFAVAPTSPDDHRQVNFGDVTFSMMQRAFEFGRARDIKSYVTVTSVALERMLVRLGLPLRRFGDGKTIRIGRVRSVACRIDVDEQSQEALFGAVAASRQLQAA